MDERVRKVTQQMDQQMDRQLTVSGLAAGVGLSVAHLTRLFRADTGLTPGAYLRARRLERARILVERTSLSVSEVMTRVGFKDRSHFARDFRLAHGVNPRTLRVLAEKAAACLRR